MPPTRGSHHRYGHTVTITAAYWRNQRPRPLGSGLDEPEDDGGSEGNGGQEDRRTPIVAGRDTAPVLQPSEHKLDTATAPVAACVVFAGLEPRPPTWDAWLDALGLQGISEPVGVVTARRSGRRGSPNFKLMSWSRSQISLRR
jgi:hypothetical protein